MTEKELLVEEYKLIQERINHFESLIWRIGSILNGSVIILVGLVLGENNSRRFLLVIVASVLFSTLWYLFENRYRRLSLILFKRLHKIERELGFKQHVTIDADDKSRKFHIDAHNLILGTAFIFPFILFVYWLIVFV